MQFAIAIAIYFIMPTFLLSNQKSPCFDSYIIQNMYLSKSGDEMRSLEMEKMSDLICGMYGV
jgi:hypothetical protein